MDLVWMVWVSGALSVLFALYLAWDVLRLDTGTPEMQRIAGMIYQGAVAFLWRQYRTIGILAIITAVIIGVLIGTFQSQELGWRTAVAFIVGAAFSAASRLLRLFFSL